MTSDKIMTAKQCQVIVHYCDGYNCHNYGICYEKETRTFLGEIEDFWSKTDESQRRLVQELVDANWCPAN